MDIESEIQKNSELYHYFLPVQEILEILREFKKRYVDPQWTTEIVSIIIDFLAFCKNSSGCVPHMPTKITNNYPKELVERWLRAKQ